MKKKFKKEDDLYPIWYEGKLYTEEECDDIFICFYHTKLALNYLNGVYVGDKIWIYPDGTMEEF